MLRKKDFDSSNLNAWLSFHKINGVKNMIYDEKSKNRIKRAEGQLRGILKMMESEKDCKSVITQLTASRSAIDKAIAVIVSRNLEQCIIVNAEKGKANSSIIEEAVNLLVKSR